MVDLGGDEVARDAISTHRLSSHSEFMNASVAFTTPWPYIHSRGHAEITPRSHSRYARRHPSARSLGVIADLAWWQTELVSLSHTRPRSSGASCDIRRDIRRDRTEMPRVRGPSHAYLRDDIAHVVRERPRDVPVLYAPHSAHVVAERRVRQWVVVGGADLRWEICARCARDTRRDMSGEM